MLTLYLRTETRTSYVRITDAGDGSFALAAGRLGEPPRMETRGPGSEVEAVTRALRAQGFREAEGDDPEALDIVAPPAEPIRSIR
jgi:hypothetical protein